MYFVIDYYNCNQKIPKNKSNVRHKCIIAMLREITQMGKAHRT